MLSIVIPTLNEEKHLPLLLESVTRAAARGEEEDLSSSPKNQVPHDEVEIIIADSGSTDKTREVAVSFGCQFHVIPNVVLPAQAKNGGAGFAQGSIIFFVDADVILPASFLKESIAEFKSRNLGVASFYLASDNKFHNFLFNLLYNLPARLTQPILPQAMNAILVKRDIHQAISGFDEQIRLGEELDYIRKAKKIGRFGILNSVKILVSTRRFSNDGWFITWLKYFLCQIHIILWGPVKSDVFGYKFNHYRYLQKSKK